MPYRKWQDAVADVQAGTIAALAGICEIVERDGGVPRDRIISRLQRVSAAAMKSDLGPLGQATIDGVIGALRSLPGSSGEDGPTEN
jgi:hypothetical protein